MIMSELGIVEDQIFKKRQQTEEMFRARDKAKRKRMKMDRTHKPTRLLGGQYTPTVHLFLVYCVRHFIWSISYRDVLFSACP